MGNNPGAHQRYPPKTIQGDKMINDPLYGFPEGRKERQKPKSTPEEWDAAQLAPWQRDYCVDELLDLLKCKRQKGVWVAACRNEMHHWEHCEFEDYTLRIMEKERERRLIKRERRKAGEDEHPYRYQDIYTRFVRKFFHGLPF